ncbi:MAG TPA: CHAD domain-containing protein [Candidatus Saccharimonadales bacterium]|nr:CHAD domain-containing protein [Candidatus Saccharimonadales bacterium]
MFLEEGGVRLLEERTCKLIDNLPGAIAGEEEPVHQVRVASRRLRVVLPILAPEPDGRKVKRLRRGLAEVVEVAGTGRDLDVSIRLFDENLLRDGEAAPEVKSLRRRLIAARGRSRRQMNLRLRELKLGRMLKDLESLRRHGSEDLFVCMARYRRARDKGAARLLRAMGEVGDRFDPAALHGVRKAARRMRYLAEVGAAFHPDLEEVPRLFKKIQDELGRIQDAHVLAERMRQTAANAARVGQDQLAARARAIASGFSDLSRGLHHGYLLMDPAEQVRRALVLMAHQQSAA